ncbi:hypothetical protein, partial [Legionella sp.]|uniref:hypothetical protein n=1 Tax=Legionella sp. TaxID=459 RepID=UPI003CB13CAD
THIRESSDNIKLAFKFKGVPTSLMISQIGFVPQGAFHKEGWTDAVQFFDAKNIGTCAYAQMNVAASHTAAEIVLEDATYTTNNKVTLMEVRGNKSSGESCSFCSIYKKSNWILNFDEIALGS